MITPEQRSRLGEIQATKNEIESSLVKHTLHKNLRWFNVYEHSIRYPPLIHVINAIIAGAPTASRRNRDSGTYRGLRNGDNKIVITFNNATLQTAGDRYMKSYVAKLELIMALKREAYTIHHPEK